MHMMSKSDLTHEEKETIRKSKESWTIVTASGTITTTEEASCQRQIFGHVDYSSITGRFNTCTLPWKCGEAHGFFQRMEGQTITDINQAWQTHSL